MNTRITIDRAGRVVLPKPVREQLQLEPGEALELESFEDYVVLRPVRGDTPLRKKQGIWVFRVGEKLTPSMVEDTMQRVREERAKDVFGKKQ